MPNLAKLLKDEIQRLARREIKAATDSLRRDNVALKRTVADLKRRLGKLESVSKRLVTQVEIARPADEEADGTDPIKARITGKMIRSIRTRLGLSQDAFARLVGVSQQSVYQWEHKDGRLDLRGDGKARIVAVRGMGKREAKAKILALDSKQ